MRKGRTELEEKADKILRKAGFKANGESRRKRDKYGPYGNIIGEQKPKKPQWSFRQRCLEQQQRSETEGQDAPKTIAEKIAKADAQSRRPWMRKDDLAEQVFGSEWLTRVRVSGGK